MSRQKGAVGLLVRRVLAAGWFGVAAVPFVLPGAGVPLGPGQWKEGLNAPGDCTSERHGVLQADVEAKCNVDMACLQTHDCEETEKRIKLFDACINARKKINDECFRGGDAGHKLQIVQREKGKAWCEKWLEKLKEKNQCKPPQYGKCQAKNPMTP